jgi:DNA ligase-1
LATLDVVVTAAEFGHGKRAGVLSDYTFAVRDGEQLLNIGKAYSGLTDKEIAELTAWLSAHTLVDHGVVREVEPLIVLEVAFNAVMQSDRHNSGYALRFPRIVRIRTDKPMSEIDSLDRVVEIYNSQFHQRQAK